MAPRNGTGYIGLDQWLALNQPQSAAMADNLVSGINAQGQKAESLLGEAGEYLQHGIDGASLNYNDEDFAGNNGLLRAEDAAKNAKATVDAGWQGPTSLEGIKPYEMGRGVATNAGQQANLAGDFYGRQALLSKEYGKGGGYSPGSQRLDSALAGAAGGDKIDAAKSQWGNLLGKFDAANTAANASAKAAEQRNKDVAKQYADNAAAMRAKYNADMAKINKQNRQIAKDEDGHLRNVGRPERDADREDKWRGNKGSNGGKANEGRYTWDFFT